MPLPEADKIFADFLAEKDQERSARILGELFEDHLIPLIKPILWKGLRSGLNGKAASDVEDLTGEIVTSFISRFNGKNDNKADQIQNIEAYFTRAAKLKISDYWRDKNPNWCSLKNKIRYLFNKGNSFSPEELITMEDKNLFALKNFKTEKSRFSNTELLKVIREKHQIKPQTDLFETVKIVLSEAKGGLLINDLTNLVYELQNIIYEMDEVQLEDKIHSIVANALSENVQSRLESQAKLRKVWVEIKALNFHQRSALLLNMQENKVSGIHLLLFLRVTSLKELAENLGISLVEMAELFNKLPLGDNEIARILNVTTKQAGNLRKVARERLQRRIKDF